MLLIGEREIEL
jgi:hypothetical protein